MRPGVSSPWLPFGASAGRNAHTCLVVFHHAGGGASFFRNWSGHPLLNGVDVYQMELPGRGRRFLEQPQSDLDVLLADLDPVLREVAGAYRHVVLFGHSLGSLFAYESALRFQERGRHPRALIVSARRAPQLATPEPWRHHMDERALIGELRRLGGTQEEVLANDELLQLFLPAIRADFKLTETYRPAMRTLIECPVVTLRGAADREVSAADVARWDAVAAGAFASKTYEGDHFYLSEPAVLAEMLGDIRQYLA